MHRKDLDNHQKIFEGKKKLKNNLFEKTQHAQTYHEILRRFSESATAIEDLKTKIMIKKSEYSRQISEIKNKYMDQLSEVKSKLDESTPELIKHINYLKKTLLVAPYKCIIVAKRYKEGTLTQQGDVELVDIIPADLHDNYIVSAQVKAQDILAIKDGAKVKLKFAALL